MVFSLGISFRSSMRNGLLSPQSVYRVSHLWNASCYRTSSKTVHIYKKLYIRKKKRKLNWFLLFYCKRCIFQLLLSVSTVVVVDSHLHWRVGSSVWPPRCQQEISLKRNCSQKLISISKILGLQKYRLFLHYLFYSERGKDHKIHLERNELCWTNSQIKQWSKMFALVHDLFFS